MNQGNATLFSERLDRLATMGLLASVIAIPITRSIELPIVGPRITIFEVVALPTILLWLSARAVSRSWSTIVHAWSLDTALLAFWVMAIVSGTTAYRLLGRAAVVWFATELVVLTYLLLLFVAARDLLVRRRAIGGVLQAWSVSAILVGVIGLVGIFEMVRCSPPLSTLVYGKGRLLATFRNPNQLAAYLVPTSMLMIGVWASRVKGSLGRLAIPGAVFSVAVLYFSASRGGAVGVTFGFIVLLLIQRTWAMWRTVASMGVMVVALMALSFAAMKSGNECFNYIGNTLTAMTAQLPESLQSARAMLHVDSSGTAHRRDGRSLAVRAVRSNDLDASIPLGGDTATSFAFRGVMARIALRFALQHPLTGIGLGTMHVHVMKLTNQGADVDAHNMTMTVLAETGFVGLALFAWCIGWCAWAAFVAFRSSPSDALQPLRAALLMALLAFLVMTLSFDGQRQRVLWMLLAVICASAHPGAFEALRPRQGTD